MWELDVSLLSGCIGNINGGLGSGRASVEDLGINTSDSGWSDLGPICIVMNGCCGWKTSAMLTSISGSIRDSRLCNLSGVEIVLSVKVLLRAKACP